MWHSPTVIYSLKGGNLQKHVDRLSNDKSLIHGIEKSTEQVAKISEFPCIVLITGYLKWASLGVYLSLVYEQCPSLSLAHGRGTTHFSCIRNEYSAT